MCNKRIVAVIPARAGSKGVPNKNIRLVKGRPLIWYAINNAKKSKYITDIIVSSDSEEVHVIANQQGVRFHYRSEDLCRDEVTLDAVIYDAVKNIDCDYVVTMQPTSPTLKSTTLDGGIEYAINNELDTLISVVNKPHLSWIKKNGKKVPAYKERLNRQFLPPYYTETGAFVVSVKSAVTQFTRIGRKVDVYEVSNDEAIDIDDFYDLQLVNYIMADNRVAIYANGNKKIGLGHICRALEIADEFYCKPDIIYDINVTQRESFGTTTHNLVGVDGLDELIKLVGEKKYTLFINDILDTSIDYMKHLREALPCANIVNFEDLGDGAKEADAVINALYSGPDETRVFKGSDYYISPKIFLMYEPIIIKEHIENILVTFGGADPQNYTDRVLKIISGDDYKNYNFVVVLGKLKNNVDELMEYNRKGNIKVLYNVKNMPELMSRCDIAITSRGRTTYELASLGIPTMAMAQNERETKHGFACSDNGFIYLGLNPSNHLIEMELKLFLETDRADRVRFQKMMLATNLRAGRKKVMDILRSFL